MRRTLWAVLVAVAVLAAAAAMIAVARPALGRAIWSSLHAYRWWALGLSVVASVVVLGWRCAAFLRQRSGSPWREHVLVAAAAIRAAAARDTPPEPAAMGWPVRTLWR